MKNKPMPARGGTNVGYWTLTVEKVLIKNEDGDGNLSNCWPVPDWKYGPVLSFVMSSFSQEQLSKTFIPPYWRIV